MVSVRKLRTRLVQRHRQNYSADAPCPSSACTSTLVVCTYKHYVLKEMLGKFESYEEIS